MRTAPVRCCAPEHTMLDLDYDTTLPSCQPQPCRADCRSLRLRANRLTTFSGLATDISLLYALQLHAGSLCHAPRVAFAQQQTIPASHKASLRRYLLQIRAGRRWFYRPQAIDHEAVAQALSDLSLTEQADTSLARLDQTSRFLASLASTLVQTPPLVLLDLRRSPLDDTLRRRILRHLAQRALHGRTILCALDHAAQSEGLSHWHVTLAASPAGHLRGTHSAHAA